MTLEAILWYLILADSIIANLGAWMFPKWYKKQFKGLWKQLPITKGWTAIYLILTLWIGATLFRLGIIL